MLSCQPIQWPKVVGDILSYEPESVGAYVFTAHIPS